MTGLMAVVFDLDDTLYPEASYALSGLRAAAEWAQAELGLDAEESTVELTTLWRQGTHGRTFDQWLTSHGLPADPWVQRLVEVYRGHRPTLVPYPGIPELLDRLAQKVRLGLVSDGYLGVQRLKLEALGLAPRFAAVVFSDEGGREAWKPSPWPYLRVLHMLACPPDRAVYVGDNPLKDFYGAREVGMGTLWLRREGGVYSAEQPPSPAHAPDAQATDLAELEERIAHWPAGSR